MTLRRRGNLRGCIGTLSPEGDLTRMVPRFALRAAFEDPRFPPLSSEELPECEIEISVLTPPAPVEDPDEIEVGRDGLIIDAEGESGLLLPQVATEWGFDRERFLAEVCRKAGLSPAAWRAPGARLWTFQAEVFAEGRRADDGAGHRKPAEEDRDAEEVAFPLSPRERDGVRAPEKPKSKWKAGRRSRPHPNPLPGERGLERGGIEEQGRGHRGVQGVHRRPHRDRVSAGRGSGRRRREGRFPPIR